MRPKARGLAQPASCPAWLEKSGPAGMICTVMDGLHRLPKSRVCSAGNFWHFQLLISSVLCWLKQYILQFRSTIDKFRSTLPQRMCEAAATSSIENIPGGRSSEFKYPRSLYPPPFPLFHPPPPPQAFFATIPIPYIAS